MISFQRVRQFTVSLILIAMVAGCASSEVDTRGKTHEIRWVVAHLPGDEIQDKALRAFQNDVSSRTQGQVKVKLIYPPFQDRQDDWFSWGYKELKEGRAEISQISSEVLSQEAKLLKVTDTPYLFASYAHAEKVFDGPIGQKLLSSIQQSTGDISAVAFTYSGGFRATVTNQNLRTAKDFSRLILSKPYSEVIEQSESQLGIKHVAGPFPATTINGLMDLYGSTYHQFHHHQDAIKKWQTAKTKIYLVETYHNLFTTVIVVNESLFKKIPVPHQGEVLAALHQLAKDERQLSINAERDYKKKLIADYQVQVNTLSLKERTQLRNKMNPTGFTTEQQNLVKQIRQMAK